jgi:hypothetical protein
MIRTIQIGNRHYPNKWLLSWIIISFVIVGLQGCNGNQKIIGEYQLDKFVLGKGKRKNSEAPILKLNSDNTFELLRNNKLNGTWRKTNLIGEENIIEFKYSDKKITGKLRGTVIYFEYPNDFDSGILNP